MGCLIVNRFNLAISLLELVKWECFVLNHAGAAQQNKPNHDPVWILLILELLELNRWVLLIDLKFKYIFFLTDNTLGSFTSTLK